MKILLIPPGKRPVRKEICGSLKSMQEIVGGPIRILYSFQDQVALICHEEGKLLGLPLNRSLRNDCDQIYDAIAGMFFLRRIPIDCDSLESLT